MLESKFAHLSAPCVQPPSSMHPTSAIVQMSGALKADDKANRHPTSGHCGSSCILICAEDFQTPAPMHLAQTTTIHIQESAALKLEEQPSGSTS